jgi:hypothetical protein
MGSGNQSHRDNSGLCLLRVGPYQPCCLQPLIRDGRNRLRDLRRRLPVVASSSRRGLALFKTATPRRKAFASALTSTLSPLLCAQNSAAMDQARGKRGEIHHHRGTTSARALRSRCWPWALRRVAAGIAVGVVVYIGCSGKVNWPLMLRQLLGATLS